MFLKHISITNKGLIALVMVSFVLTVIIGSLVSTFLYGALASRLRDSEISSTFSAIRAGPLALARLHASAISNDFLAELMDAKFKDHKLFVAAKITGGQNNALTYASWSQEEQLVPQNCLHENREELAFKDSLNPFFISIKINKCYKLPIEANLLFITIASVLIALLGEAILLSFASVPIIQSLRLTKKVIEHPSAAEDFIPYKPLRDLTSLAKKALQLESDAAFARLATQVAHDIRSPLSALNIASARSFQMPEDNRKLIKSSLERINQIADDLLRRAKEKKTDRISSVNTICLANLIDNIIQEKRVQVINPKIKIKLICESNSQITTTVGSSEISRVISNLINNSIESLPDAGGSVEAVIRDKNDGIEVDLNDNGSGIQPGLLKKFQTGDFGISMGKDGINSGHGLGLEHAHNTIQSIGGRMEITSSLASGTNIKLFFPR